VRVLMLFLDGVGIGKRDPAVNPFFAARLPTLRWLLDGELPSLRHRRIQSSHASLVPLDATLGVDGLPQSGTGQTALFTGLNGAKIIGRHFGPYPYSTLRPLIKEHNIFKRVKEAGRRPYFANAFPQRFFDYFDQRQTRMTVTTMSCVMTGLSLLRADDLQAGRGVSADITNQGWAELGYPDLASIQPAEAGRRLANLAGESEYVLFEYWKTDKAGHSQDMRRAAEVLELFDEMLGGVVAHIDLRKAILIIVSDHGNIEDLSTKVHTRHPTPAIVYGRAHERIAKRLLHSSPSAPSSLTSVTPTVLEIITRHIAS
jgi:2,3-bisphosphoglycerate-independent phosphoglycerate mutase